MFRRGAASPTSPKARRHRELILSPLAAYHSQMAGRQQGLIYDMDIWIWIWIWLLWIYMAHFASSAYHSQMAGRQQGIDVDMVIDMVIDMEVDLTKDMNLNTVASCCLPLGRQQGLSDISYMMTWIGLL